MRSKSKKKITGDAVESFLKKKLEDIYPFVEGPPVKVKWARRDYFGLFDFITVDEEGKMIGHQCSKKYLSSKSRDFKERWSEWTGNKIYWRWKEGKWYCK